MDWCSKLIGLICEVLKVLLSVSLSLGLILPVFVIVFGTNELARLLVTVYLKWHFGSKVQLVKDGKDGIFCHCHTTYIRLLLEFERPFDVGKFEKLVKSNILENGSHNNTHDDSGTSHRSSFEWKMRRIISKKCGYFCWKEDESFRWSNHCRSHASDKPVSQKQLMDIINGLSHDLGDLQPQWQVIYVPNIESKRFGVILNFHHAYADPLSLVTMIAERLSPVKPFPYVVNPLINNIPWQTRALFATKAYSYFGWTILKWIVKYRINQKNADRKNEEGDDGIPEHCHITSVELSSTRIKSIRRIANVPIPAILISVYIRALEKIFRTKAEKLPKEISCGLSVAKFPYQPTLSNEMIFIEVNPTLPKTLEGKEDVISSLEETSTVLSMAFDDCYVTHDFRILGRLPYRFMKFPKISPGWFMHSNIPFARKKVKIGGAVPVCISAWPTLMRDYPYHLIASNISYGETINACLIAKASKFLQEDMNLLVEEIPKQLKSLEKTMCQLATMYDQELDHLPARTSHLCLHQTK